jgi:3',5'-cyclic AMP phosphodiesterase CpdA
VFTGDTQGWFDDTKDMVKSINNHHTIDFVVHGGDITDFGITKEFEWQRDILNGLQVPYVVIFRKSL